MRYRLHPGYKIGDAWFALRNPGSIFEKPKWFYAHSIVKRFTTVSFAQRVFCSRRVKR